MILYILIALMFFIGLYGMIAKKNIIKIIIGMNIVGYASNLLFVLLGYKWDGIAPILTEDMSFAYFLEKAVDPLPQALVLTSIVIDLAFVAFLAALAIRLFEKYGTFDIDKIRRLKG
ncbi:MAG: cation:proton antiporter [Elusimicrobia bacterium]|jgi:multicomponent Na+:H+ antiporter subunit C|nr:cation:proton antiporter [Elusimicrobiota bacterium]